MEIVAPGAFVRQRDLRLSDGTQEQTKRKAIWDELDPLTTTCLTVFAGFAWRHGTRQR